jgi:molybdopterin-guanine dinucleotide biosynthesis protein A
MDPKDITGLILAGGRGSRMGGVDKGLQNFNGQPMALHTLQRLQLQVGPAIINANRNQASYASFGVPVWPDVLSDYAGPLAGFLTGLSHCDTPYLVTVPCDTPLFPLDLVGRLAQALEDAQADIAMASAPETDAQGHTRVRTQPVFCLMRTDLRASLTAFTQTGGRKIDAWTAQHTSVIVPFNASTDDARAFFNANTLEELQQLQTR